MRTSILLTVALLAASCSWAAMITQTLGYGPTTPDFNQDLLFSRFDTLGGARTLTAIEVLGSLSAVGGSITLDNDSPSVASGTFGLGAKCLITSTDVALLNVLNQPVMPQLDASHADAFSLGIEDGDGPYNVDANADDGMRYLGGTETDSESGYIGSAFWGAYVGTGTYKINAAATQYLNYGGVSGVEGSFTPVTGSGSVTVNYYYDDNIPEPATATLMLFGLGALVAVRRRRSA